MESKVHCTLLEVLESCRVRRFSGAVNVKSPNVLLTIWFVRGSLAHAKNSVGETGWTALESLKTEMDLAISECIDELPPQRTIRVDTFRLIKAMKSSFKAKRIAPMHVPLPLHARLQQKFVELKKRVSGLQSFETAHLDGPENHDPNTHAVTIGTSPGALADRTILERDPRGAKWIHRTESQQLIVIGDESITTSELMWAGSELWKELDRVSRKTQENE